MTTQSLDQEIVSAIEHMTTRYKYFREEIRLRPDSLDELDAVNRAYISRICHCEEIDSEPYLLMYEEGVR